MTTSYANAGGTGDRTASIVVTSPLSLANGPISRVIDGDTTTNVWWMSGGQTSQNIKFDFGAGKSKVIDTFKWYASNNTSQGTWKWQGSNDDSTYVDVGSSFTLAGAAGGGANEITEPAGNTTGYRYWNLVQVSGSTSSSPFDYEIEFKIADAATANTKRSFMPGMLG